MDYTLRIFYADRIQDILIKNGLTIGKAGQVSVQGTEKLYTLHKGAAGCEVSDHSGQRSRLDDGSFLHFTDTVFGVCFQHEKAFYEEIDFMGKKNILIGRNPNCNFVLPSRKTVYSDRVRVSGEHVHLIWEDGKWRIVLVKEQALVYLNGVLVTGKAYLGRGDRLDIGKYTIQWENDRIVAAAGQETIEEKSVRQNATVLLKRTKVEPPTFNRAPHIHTQLPTYVLKLPEKQHIGEKPEMNWLSTLLPPVVMMVIMLATFFLGGGTGSLFLTLPISMLVSVLNYRSQKKKFFGKKESIENQFKEETDEKSREIAGVKNRQLQILRNEYPSLEDCCNIVSLRDTRMWRCTPDEECFLDLRLGVGVVPTRYQIQQNNWAKECRQLIEEAEMLKNAPVSIPLKNYQNVGLVGDRNSILRVMKNIVVQTAVNHFYDEVKIVAIYPESERMHWEWMRWFPHVFSKDRQQRYMACKQGDVWNLCRQFEEILDKRCNPHFSGVQKKEHYLFLIGDHQMVAKMQLMNYFSRLNPKTECSVVFMAPNIASLPAECQAVIEADANMYGTWYPKQDANQTHPFVIDSYYDSVYETIARTMAPIRLVEGAEQQQFPANISFLEGYKVKRVEELDIEKRWKNARVDETLSVPVGVKQNGETFCFDISARRHGTHGMVAGQSGSGKSEMVQSWILSMAVNFSPQDVTFIIIDYKGDGLLAPFRKLPHLAGTISNLDYKIERNVIALEKELQRRELLFKKYGVNKIAEYKKLYRQGKIKESLPILLVFVDEFAEFKSQHPEFIGIIESIYTKGRALGVWITILAQDLSSVITNKIEANARFRWCMQVTTGEASRSMLATLDAYTMKKAPGRGFVKVGDFEVYEEIQSFWSGASYVPDRGEDAYRIPPLAKVALNGNRTTYVEWEKSMGVWSEEKEIHKIVSYIDEYVKKNKIQKARQVWCPPLDREYVLDDMLTHVFDGENWAEKEKIEIPIGQVDDPVNQTQYPLKLETGACGHISVQGGPSSGKTTFLMSAVMALAKQYSPADVEFYFIDYHKWAMNLFRNLPHTRGICVGNEEELADVIQKLQYELNKRQVRFAKAGIISMESYCALQEKIPYIFVVVDGISNAWNASTELQDMLKEIAMKGVSYGIYLLASAPGTAFPYNIVNFFKTRISLRQLNASDYRDIVGNTNGIMPDETCPGRGLIKLGHVVEFQTAYPFESKNELEQTVALREMIGQMAACWNEVKQSEEEVSKKKWKESVSENCIAIGVDDVTGQLVQLGFEDKHCVLVSALRKETQSKTLAVLAEQITAMNGAQTVFYDNQNCDLSDYPAEKYFALGDKAGDQYLEELMTILAKRQEERETDTRKIFSKIIIFIADLKEYFVEAEDASIVYLRDIVYLAKDLGVWLIVAGSSEGISYLGTKGEKFTNALLKQQNAVLLEGSIAEHVVFDSGRTYVEKHQKLNEGEAYYLNDDKMLKLNLLEV